MKFKVIKTIRFQSVCFSDDSSVKCYCLLRLCFSKGCNFEASVFPVGIVLFWFQCLSTFLHNYACHLGVNLFFFFWFQIEKMCHMFTRVSIINFVLYVCVCDMHVCDMCVCGGGGGGGGRRGGGEREDFSVCVPIVLFFLFSFLNVHVSACSEFDKCPWLAF